MTTLPLKKENAETHQNRYILTPKKNEIYKVIIPPKLAEYMYENGMNMGNGRWLTCYYFLTYMDDRTYLNYCHWVRSGTPPNDSIRRTFYAARKWLLVDESNCHELPYHQRRIWNGNVYKRCLNRIPFPEAR